MPDQIRTGKYFSRKYGTRHVVDFDNDYVVFIPGRYKRAKNSTGRFRIPIKLWNEYAKTAKFLS